MALLSPSTSYAVTECSKRYSDFRYFSLQICGQHQSTLVQANHEHGAATAAEKSERNQKNSRRNQGQSLYRTNK